MEIHPEVHETQVADMVVRVNREGVEISQSDFLMALLSVFGEEVRTDLEHFCHDAAVAPKDREVRTPHNAFIRPSPDELLRVAVGLSFYRVDQNSIFQILRGIDLETSAFSEEKASEQFKSLKGSVAHTLNLDHWHGFFGALEKAGFISRELISSSRWPSLP